MHCSGADLVAHFTEGDCIAVPYVYDVALLGAKQGATDTIASSWPSVESFTDAEQY